MGSWKAKKEFLSWRRKFTFYKDHSHQNKESGLELSKTAEGDQLMSCYCNNPGERGTVLRQWGWRQNKVKWVIWEIYKVGFIALDDCPNKVTSKKKKSFKEGLLKQLLIKEI